MEHNHKQVKSKKHLILHWVFYFVFSSLAFSVLLLSTVRPYLVIDMNSKVVGISQVFFSQGEGYSEENSTFKPVNRGQNVLYFPLAGLSSSVRWDPLTQGSNIEVNNIYISIFGLKLNNVTLSPSHDIEQVKSSNDKLLIIMSDLAADPQMDVQFDFLAVYNKYILLCGILGSILAFFTLTLIFFKQKVACAINYFDRIFNELILQMRHDGFTFREIGILIFISSILYSYFISNFSLSIDGEMAALRQDPSVWISQQRWFVYLVEKYLFPLAATSFAPYVMLIMSLSVSYTMILRAHGYKESWKTYISYPVFCIFPTWWAISEFPANLPALAFGLLFISFSIYLYFGVDNRETLRNRGSLLRNSIIVIMLTCAISAYQSLLLMFLCFAFGILLVKNLHYNDNHQTTFKPVAKALFNLLPLIFFALILYSVANHLAQRFVSSDSGYIDNFIKYDVIFKAPFSVLYSVFRELITIYSGDYIRYGASLGIVGFVISLATLIILRFYVIKTPVNLLLWIGVLTTPFALHIVSGGSVLPLRTLLAVAYVIWLSSMILLSSKRPSFIFVSIIIVGLLQIKNISLISQYIASTTILKSHDKVLAADIYRRIGELDKDFDRNSSLKIDFYGNKSFHTVYATVWSGTTQASFFAWDDGNIVRMVNYMKIMGYENIVIPDKIERIAMTPIFNEMPIWPAAGAVRKVGDVYLVRLGKEADPIHAQFKKSL